MLGVALLDGADRPLRPALLWNDGRAGAECVALERDPGLREAVGCRAMPGFPAPKLLWLAHHEAAALAQTRRTLLTKDYVRLKLSGEAATDLADGSATLLMDTHAGVWYEEMSPGLRSRPRSCRASSRAATVSATLRPALSERWGLRRGLPIAGGAGDNMCGAVGAGVVQGGVDAFISLGTSGVYFWRTTASCPALQAACTRTVTPCRIFLRHYGVVLSAASALVWLAALLGKPHRSSSSPRSRPVTPLSAEIPVFTPYLGGERTPHDDALATGTFSNLRFATVRPISAAPSRRCCARACRLPGRVDGRARRSRISH